MNPRTVDKANNMPDNDFNVTYMVCHPGLYGQHVQEYWNQEQILQAYYPYWSKKMREKGHADKICKDLCISDWICVNLAKVIKCQ